MAEEKIDENFTGVKQEVVDEQKDDFGLAAYSVIYTPYINGLPHGEECQYRFYDTGDEGQGVTLERKTPYVAGVVHGEEMENAMGGNHKCITYCCGVEHGECYEDGDIKTEVSDPDEFYDKMDAELKALSPVKRQIILARGKQKLMKAGYNKSGTVVNDEAVKKGISLKKPVKTEELKQMIAERDR